MLYNSKLKSSDSFVDIFVFGINHEINNWKKNNLKILWNHSIHFIILFILNTTYRDKRSSCTHQSHVWYPCTWLHHTSVTDGHIVSCARGYLPHMSGCTCSMSPRTPIHRRLKGSNQDWKCCIFYVKRYYICVQNTCYWRCLSLFFVIRNRSKLCLNFKLYVNITKGALCSI